MLNEFIKDDAFYEALKEIAWNTMQGKLPLTVKQKRNLRKCKKGLFCLACTRNKRKAVSQLSGGFWTFLLPIVYDLIRRNI